MNMDEMFDEIYDEIIELAKFHSVDVPIIYGDGEESTDKMIPIYELKLKNVAEIPHACIGDECKKNNTLLSFMYLSLYIVFRSTNHE